MSFRNKSFLQESCTSKCALWEGRCALAYTSQLSYLENCYEKLNEIADDLNETRNNLYDINKTLEKIAGVQGMRAGISIK